MPGSPRGQRGVGTGHDRVRPPLAFFFTLISAALGTGLWSALAWADSSVPIRVQGVAVIEEGNQAAARTEAIDRAIARAVAIALGLAEPESLPLSPGGAAPEETEASLPVSSLLADPKAYVTSYRILHEEAGGDLFIVSLEVSLNRARLEEDYLAGGILGPRAGARPRVLTAIAVREPGREDFGTWWSGRQSGRGRSLDQEFARALQEGGVEWISTEAATRSADLRGVARLPVLGAGESRRIGSETGADWVLYGTAELYDSPRGDGRIDVDINWHAVRVRDGMKAGPIVARASSGYLEGRSQRSRAIDEALRAGVRIAAPRLISLFSVRRSVPPVSAGEGPAGAVMEVRMIGVRSPGEFERVKSYLDNEAHGVQRVVGRRFSAGEATLLVYLRRGAEDLSEGLGRKEFDGFRLKVRRVERGRIHLEVIPDDPGLTEAKGRFE